MTTMTEPPQSFRLSMLVNDTRYRSYTFQLVAIVLLALAVGWLASNAAANLAAQGLDISFGWLDQRAGYDINQTPIAYTSASSHLRAAVVGVMNTLIVAVLGCVTATVLGVMAGVLRLSPNWLISKLMAIYVEAFRNVPVLIWILIIFSVTTAAFPAPSAFRGDDPQASTVLGMAFTNRGVYVPRPVMDPLGWLVVAIALASIAGVFLWRRHARRALYDQGREVPVLWPSLAILLLPTLIAFFVLGRPIGLEFPELAGFNFRGGINILGSLIALWLALAVYTGAFIAENVRAGIQAVSRGQTEAAASPRPAPGADHVAGGAAAGAQHHHPAADLAVPQPDQELLARHRGGLHGRHRHARGHHAQPDGARDRVRAAADALLPRDLPEHLGRHERLQQLRPAEGALT